MNPNEAKPIYLPLKADRCYELEQRSSAVISAGIEHDFANRTDELAGLLNVFLPGGFEEKTPDIVAWFAQRADETA